MKKNQKQSAAFDMKRIKKMEGELGKLQGQKMSLEQQEGLIQGA